MKLVLILYICSSLHSQCQAPRYLSNHDTWYNCMMEGYKNAAILTKKISEEQINKHLIYVSFTCKDVPTI